MTTYSEYRIQLKDGFGAVNITTAGGAVHVAKAGSPDKQAIVDKTGAALTNPLVPTRGFINFFIPDTITTGVDLYIQAPGGQFIIAKSVLPSGPNEFAVNTSKSEQFYKIPFSIADAVAATEQSTGFVVPANSTILDRLHGMGLLVTALESGKTIDFGTAEASAAGGDSDGFCAAASLTSAGAVIGTNGTLYSTNAPATSTALVANLNIVYVLSSGAVAAKGFLYLPVRLL